MSAGVMVTLPDASNCTVISWQTAVGEILSSTVTVAVQFDELPDSSVTVKVTVLAPISLQSKVFGDALKTRLPGAVQLSVDPPSKSAPTILALPVASS